MPSNEVEALRISRKLTPENRMDLLAWVRLAYVAEISALKSSGFNSSVDGVLAMKPQEYSCKDKLRRRKK